MEELFNKSDWHSFIESKRKNLKDEIGSMNGNRLLNTAEDDLVKYFEKKYYFYIPELDEDEISVEQNEVEIDVSRDPRRSIWDRNRPFYLKGTKITFHIPFTGKEVFFSVQPSKYYMKRFFGDIAGSSIIHSISSVELTAEQVQSSIEQFLREVNEYLQTQRNDSVSYNNSLEAKIREQLHHRREKLLKDQNLVASLGFKMKSNSSMPSSYIAPEVKRKKLQLPPASSAPYKPEPILSDSDYNNILTILENMTLVMERSPEAFRNMGTIYYIVQKLF